MRFARPGTLLGLDYDGTLAPIKRRPETARLSDSTRTLLRHVALEYPTVLITGRARRDARHLLGDLTDIEIIGSHGVEGLEAPHKSLEARVAGWRAVLDRRLGAQPGIVIEDKRYSLSVHYRLSPRPSAARVAVMRAVTALQGARMVGGKSVINLLPHGAPHKGAALLAACGRHHSPRAIYVGDDETDEDVFALSQPEKVLTVRVGQRRGSAASYYLRTRGDVDKLLRLLLTRRTLG